MEQRGSMDEYLNSVNLNNCLWITVLAAGRIYGAMYFCPLFSGNYLPQLLKMALALFLAWIIFPYFNNYQIHILNITGNLVLLIKEIAIGIMLGFLFSFPLWLVENVGNLIDMQRGEQLGAIVNQTTQNPSSSISQFMLQSFIAYIVVMNGLLFFFQSVLQSFLIFPIDKLLPENVFGNLEIYIDYFARYCYWVVILALPLLFILFLMDLTLGLIGSFVPSMNITILAMPIKSLVALFFLIFYIGVIYHVDINKFMEPIKGFLLK
mgnify:CR=1 FL=1